MDVFMYENCEVIYLPSKCNTRSLLSTSKEQCWALGFENIASTEKGGGSPAKPKLKWT